MNDTVSKARALRRDQTEAEKKLWKHLRGRNFENVKFRRQHPIPPYIADFFSEEHKLVIEIDGGQHSADTDKERTAYLNKKGYTVLRFWNNDVLKNTEGVLHTIRDALDTPHPPGSATASPGPSLSRRERGSKRICLGKITAAHGVKGLIKIFPYGDDPYLIETLGPVYTSESGAGTLKIKLKNPQGKFFLAEADGIADRTEAEKLKGTELWVNRGSLPQIEEPDSFYIEDLIGLDVFADKEKIGAITGVENYGAGDLLNIMLTNGRDFLLPFKDECVISVDINVGITIQDHERFIL